MNFLKTLALITLATGCMTSEPPETATEASDLGVVGVAPLLAVTTTEHWDPRTNVPADIWPANAGIASTQVLIKNGGTDPVDGTAMALAFVVWNPNTVNATIGHIYWFHIGTGTEGPDFQNAKNQILNARALANPNHSEGSGGNPGGGGTPPVPHPQVDGWAISFPQNYLNNVLGDANTIQGGTSHFQSY